MQTSPTGVKSKHRWHQIRWQEIFREVRQMQAEIVKAEQAGDQARVRHLQDQLVNSQAAKLLAVHQVTSTGGKRSPGVDGRLWDTPDRKIEAVQRLDSQNYQPRPARRVTISKSEGKTRPLGILTMHDRAMQALYLFALDPIAETRADPHSYGFRKFRSTADAIARCEEIFSHEEQAWWILDADIERCFDTIDHDWLLQHIPLDSDILRRWLTVGYMEQGHVYTPDRGLPQGGILSPTLANMALDGLESLLDETATRYRRDTSVYLVRYADDFLVISPHKRFLRREVRPRIEEFLNVRGMKLSPQKTRVVHLKHGLQFLGYHLQYTRSRVHIMPAKENFKKVLQKIDDIIRNNPDASPTRLIQVLTPVIRGWAEYYKYSEHRELFTELDRQVIKRLWTWVMAQQSGLFKRRQVRQYFMPGPDNIPTFVDQAGQMLHCARETPLNLYTPIDPACNAYDSAWKSYLKQRQSPSE